MGKLTGFVIFLTGAAIGSAATWYFVKDKYEKKAQADIESVKSKFTYKKEESAKKSEPEKEAIKEVTKEKPNIAEYAKMLSKEGYTDYSVSEKREEKGETPKPYVISPDQFREFDDYDVISLTYYADHILADDNDEIVEDVEDVVGFESLGHFGEYEDDSVYVRNERLKVDYEILLDQRRYTEVIQSKPYLIRED